MTEMQKNAVGWSYKLLMREAESARRGVEEGVKAGMSVDLIEVLEKEWNLFRSAAEALRREFSEMEDFWWRGEL